MGNVGLLFTFCLLVGTLLLAFTRFRMRPESSWPLVYYLGVVFYLNAIDLVLEPYVVYVAVIAALLLRFEFMNDRLVLFVRVVEFATLAHIGWSLLHALIREVS
jgi:hypothetical protein